MILTADQRTRPQEEKGETDKVAQLIHVFNQEFGPRYQTKLVRGDDEPIYLPVTETRSTAQIVFAHGYFASAMHELAHWCIAGKKRRGLVDFGYWYQPDGRDEAKQKEFESVEVKPQAMEWILAVSCRHPFRFSADNLNGTIGDQGPFQAAVKAQVDTWLSSKIPTRANRLRLFLAQSFDGPQHLSPQDFRLDHLDPLDT